MDPIEAPGAAGFDFEAHRRAAVDAYARVRPLYVDFSHVIKTILNDAIQRKNLKIPSIEARGKSLDSFAEKAMRPSEDDPNRPKYVAPLEDITDLAAVRVITFFPRTLSDIDSAIREQFQILEHVDHAKSLESLERFGYQSVHYLVRLSGQRTKLPEYERFGSLVAEIQVRTVLQHAWAEIEHDIQYKSPVTIPRSIRRRFMALAGMLEIADREFQAIQDSDEELRQEARTSVELGNLESVEITPDALHAYLDKKFGPDLRMSSFSYDWTAKLLRQLGFVNFKQVDECIGGYDNDKVSRIIYGARQGQLTRFEALLLAGMGRTFGERHPWKDTEWFMKTVEAKLDRLRAADFPNRQLRP